MTANLPIPPSTNHLRGVSLRKSKTTGRTKAIQHKTSEYKAWQQAAVAAVKADMKPAEKFPVSITVRIFGGDGWNPARDVSNVIKPVEDALVKAKVLPDDNCKYVNCIRAEYFPPSEGDKATCLVEVL